MTTNQYAHPEVLVETEWVAQNLNRPNIRYVEVDVDTTSYEQGHIPGAVDWNWQRDMQDPVRRDIPSADAFKTLLEQAGISNDTTVILYGDNNNWFAAYTFWLMKYYGHEDVRLMNGGCQKWVNEGRPLTTATNSPAAATYKIGTIDKKLRALRGFVEESVEDRTRAMGDRIWYSAKPSQYANGEHRCGRGRKLGQAK